MIIVDLSCREDHRFEGWFRSSDDFRDQQSRGLVSCPHCGSADVRRVPSATHIASAVEVPNSTSPEAAVPPSPLAMLKAVIGHVLANAENVGKDFPEEARRIHYHESPARAIYGEASDEACEALKEEGIEVVRLPIPKPKDFN